MIWGGKRYVGLQVYKRKGESDFVLVDWNIKRATSQGLVVNAIAGVLVTGHPENYDALSETEINVGLLDECYYPLSEKQMFDYTDGDIWHERFDEIIQAIDKNIKEREEKEKEQLAIERERRKRGGLSSLHGHGR